MDCDGPKHALLIDEDGSLSNSTGYAAITARTDYNMTAFFLPEQLLTLANGTRQLWSNLVRAFGTRRAAPACEVMAAWGPAGGYRCPGLRMEMFVAESLDVDTETRQIAPVALSSGGFTDVLTGCVGGCGSGAGHSEQGTDGAGGITGRWITAGASATPVSRYG
jgi:hypothetical protein